MNKTQETEHEFNCPVCLGTGFGTTRIRHMTDPGLDEMDSCIACHGFGKLKLIMTMRTHDDAPPMEEIDDSEVS